LPLVVLSLSIPAGAIAVIISWRRVPRRMHLLVRRAGRRRGLIPLFSELRIGARMVLAPVELSGGTGSSIFDRRFPQRAGISVNLTCCPLARARDRARRQRVSRIGGGAEQSDPLEPPGRRCGCWSTSPFQFSGIVVRRFRFGATMKVGGSGRSMMMSAGAGAARATGSSTTDRKICSTDRGALALARAELRPPRH